MTRLPWSAEFVLKRLNSWRRAARTFKAHRATNGLYRWRDAWGTERTTTHAEVRAWRRRVAQLAHEAKEREARRDWQWFEWLAEFGTMLLETADEDFREQYQQTIEKAHHAARQRRRAARSSADARAEQATLPNDIRAEYARHDRLGTPARERAGKIANKFGTTPSYVRDVLKSRKKKKRG